MTGECYNHVASRVQAVALANPESWEFWTNRSGYGREFYERNKRALERKVDIHRYFVFSATEKARLESDTSYRACVITGLQVYLNELPRTSLWLTLEPDWGGYFRGRVMDEERAKANHRFLLYYNDTFPDVSLFDESVASLWRGAASEKIDKVRIAWEKNHVACVNELFKVILAADSTLKIKASARAKATDLLDEFLTLGARDRL
jgi:hypothetical protein